MTMKWIAMTAKRALANSPLPVKFEVETASTMAKGVDKLKKRTIRCGAVRFGAARQRRA